MTPADMREAAAQAIEDESHEHPGSEFHYSIAAGVVRALSIPEAPALPGIDLGAVEAALAVMAKAPWRTELDRNGQENIRADNEMWVALLPHQCVAAIETEQRANAAAIVFLRNHAPALCAALRSVTAERDALLAERQRRDDERDAWEGSIVDKATARIARSDQASHEARERLRAVARETAAERDALRRAVEEARGQRDIARSEAGRCHDMLRERDGAICEAREQLRQWERMAGPGHPLRRPVADALAALTSAGQERTEPGVAVCEHDWQPAGSDAVMCRRCEAYGSYKTERGVQFIEAEQAVPVPTFADGVRAERRGGPPKPSPIEEAKRSYDAFEAEVRARMADMRKRGGL